jgi:hypothetical protein
MRTLRLAVLTLATALVLVPTVARARQHVEYRDATRLSIKHSWLGVAPQPRALVAPQPVVVMPAITVHQPAVRPSLHPLAAAAPSPHPVLDSAPEPLRGPPSPLV